MIKGVYSLFDKKAKIYMNVFTDINDGTAIRQMQQAAAQEGSIISTYPSDYALYRITQWDDETGQLLSQKKSLVIEIDQLTNKENTNG